MSVSSCAFVAATTAVPSASPALIAAWDEAYWLLAGELIGYLPEHFAAPWVASGALRCIDLPELD